MAASRAESDKVTGTVCGAQAPHPLVAQNPCALPASCAGSATFGTHGIPRGQQGAGIIQKSKTTTAQREGSGCNCPAFSWAFCLPHLVLGPCRAAPENVALAGTSLDGDRSFQTELESP